MKIASFFGGAGGLDLGFEQAGYDVVYANEFDKHIWDTYRLNHPDTYLDTRSIVDLTPEDIPVPARLAYCIAKSLLPIGE